MSETKKKNSSAVKGDRPAKRSIPIVPPNDSLAMLKSAAAYMRAAGLRVQFGQVNGTLVMRVEPAEIFRLQSGEMVFRSSAPDLSVKPVEDAPTIVTPETNPVTV